MNRSNKKILVKAGLQPDLTILIITMQQMIPLNLLTRELELGSTASLIYLIDQN
jgi:hypothetical protein